MVEILFDQLRQLLPSIVRKGSGVCKFIDEAQLSPNGQTAPIAQIMLGEAVHNGSDLLVIGAYSHARWRELLFGGTTRTLLTETLVPVLVSK